MPHLISPWDLNVPDDARDYLRLMRSVGLIVLEEKDRIGLPDEEILELARVVFLRAQPPALAKPDLEDMN